MANQTVVILDFGGQYREYIARRVREFGVYSIIKPCNITAQELAQIAPIGIIFSGGPRSLYEQDAPVCDGAILELGIPILGICYGMEFICHALGGELLPSQCSEYGVIKAHLNTTSPLFSGLEAEQHIQMCHADIITRLPGGFSPIAQTPCIPIAAYENAERKIYGLQFRPEVETTKDKKGIIQNFLFKICNAAGDHTMEKYLAEQIKDVRERVGKKKILLALSGGVDSSVCAALLSEAVPGQLVCVFVDHGCMRKGEAEQIKTAFSKRKLDLICVDAKKRFLDKLAGVVDPEEKRKIIGREFVRTFEDEAAKLNNPEFLAQGTIYPDIVESGIGKAALVKSHHNVGGLPKDLGFEGVVEPLNGLFKDEVRQLGIILGLPRQLVFRQPFPGPGLAIRVIGEVTEEKLNILRDADFIVREEIRKSRVKSEQYFAVLTDTMSVGVTEGVRTYERLLAIRAVRTNDFMTCEYARLPYSLLTRISSRITSEVSGINRIVYDITSKPPATIEWE